MTKILNVDAAVVRFLCERQESDFFDRKAFGIAPNKVQKLAVGFANADGGEIAIGIADDSDVPDPGNRWQGAPDIESFNDVLQAIFNLNPTVPFRYEFVEWKGRPRFVIRVYVEKSSEICKTPDGKVYQRVGASTIPVSDPAKIAELGFAKGSQSYENTVLADVPPELLVESKAMQNFVTGARDIIEPLSYCINEQIITYKEFHPLAAGVLLYTDNPPAFFPKRCGIKIAYYDTKLETPERDHLKETYTISGPLFDQIHSAVDRITSLLSAISIFTDGSLTKVSYPPEAIWEVLVNAVIHRDYSISDDIQVLIFQNRVEIISPGRLPGFVNISNILEVRYNRNSKIVRCLNRYSNPPNKDLGEGLNTTFQKMQEWKLKAPQFFETQNAFKVVLSHTPLARPEELVLEFLHENAEIKNSQARAITGIRSENQMKEVFYRLKKEGRIERVPGRKGSASAWRLLKDASGE